MDQAVCGLVRDLLARYDEAVTEAGPFEDQRVQCAYQFGDPGVARPGTIELALMPMDPKIDPKYHSLRFLAVRVRKSREGGWASATCLHGTRAGLRTSLEGLLRNPAPVVNRIDQLANGLAEETDPDLWR